MPSLDDLNSRHVVSETPSSDDIVPFFDVSEFGSSPVKRTTIAALVAAAGASFTEGTAVNAVAATGSITFGTPTNGDTVEVNSVVYTKVAAGATGNQFVNIAGLTALLEATADLTASSNGTVISLTAVPAGDTGNAINLVLGEDNAGTMSVSGPLLSGGVDGTLATAAYSIIYGDGDFLYVPIDANTTADSNWRKIPIADENGVLEVSVEFEDMAGEVIPNGVVARNGDELRIGNGEWVNGRPLEAGVRTIQTLTTFNDTWVKLLDLNIPAAYMVDGDRLMIEGEIYASYNWPGSQFEFLVRDAADPSVPPDDADSSGFGGQLSTAATTGYQYVHQFKIITDVSALMGYAVTGVCRTTASNNSGSGGVAVNIVNTTDSFGATTLGVDSVVELWFYKETTSAPASLLVDARYTVVPLS